MIHYHGTPLSSMVNASKVLAKRHAMVSHASPDHIAVAAAVCQSFVIDNGAFSHFTKNAPKTDWSDFYAWAEQWLAHPACDWALIPDVIGGSEEENDALLEQWPHGKHRGVPVWHLHESIERLERLAGEFPRVALGSSGEYWKPGTPAWWFRIDQALSAICDGAGRPRCKLHGLRMLDVAIFAHMPLASADSVNAGMNCGRTAKLYDVTPDVGATVICERIEAEQAADHWDAVVARARRKARWTEHAPLFAQQQGEVQP